MKFFCRPLMGNVWIETHVVVSSKFTEVWMKPNWKSTNCCRIFHFASNKHSVFILMKWHENQDSTLESWNYTFFFLIYVECVFFTQKTYIRTIQFVKENNIACRSSSFLMRCVVIITYISELLAVINDKMRMRCLLKRFIPDLMLSLWQHERRH